MSVLVDSSIWIEYFRGSDRDLPLEYLIEENLVAVNDVILAELLPPLRIRRQNRLIRLLRELRRDPIRIDWDDVVDMQTTCLRNGINRVGIPDLIIAQNAIQNELELFTLDRHFLHLSEHLPLRLY